MRQLLPHLNFPIELFHLLCNSCKKDFYAETYDEMASFDIIHCSKCGSVVRISWYEPLSKKIKNKAHSKSNKYNAELIESYLKSCSCGGNFLYTAEPRCPYCHSNKVEKIKGVKAKFISYHPDSIWKDEVKDL